MRDVIRLLKLVALLRFVILAAMGAVLLWGGPALWGHLWLIPVLLAPVVFVLLPGLSSRLPANVYLVAGIFLLITSQSLEITATTSSRMWGMLLAQTNQRTVLTAIAWRGESFFYLLMPVVLAAWAYGYRGMLWAATWAVLTYTTGGAWLWVTEGVLPLGFLVSLLPRTLILYVVPWLVVHLVMTQRRQHEALRAAHVQLQRKAALAEQLATSRERNRLAREMHDTLAHSLSGLSVQLQAVGTLLDNDPPTAREALRGAQQTARGGLDEARRAITALRASPLEDLGLAQALRRRVAALCERTGIEAECSVSGDFTDLNPAVEQEVYRVADEALVNTERHARARHVDVRLARADGRVTLVIRDDGRGFEAAHLSPEGDGHFGLLGMRERAESLGGTLEIASQPQQGTTVHLSIEE